MYIVQESAFLFFRKITKFWSHLYHSQNSGQERETEHRNVVDTTKYNHFVSGICSTNSVSGVVRRVIHKKTISVSKPVYGTVFSRRIYRDRDELDGVRGIGFPWSVRVLYTRYNFRFPFA